MMGYDIVAYIDIDYQAIEKYIKDNKLDIEENQKQILEWYLGSHYPEINIDDVSYYYNKKCDILELSFWYGTNFIRDDQRFNNKRYIMKLEKELNEKWPSCLNYINHNLRSREDAIEISKGLRLFFKEDEDLMYFANWLDMTSKYCSTYELDY